MANSKKKSTKGSITSNKKKTDNISKTRLPGLDDNKVNPSSPDLIKESSHKNRVYKFKSELFNKESTWTHDPNLDKLQGKVWAPKKLAEANRLLRNLKTPLPK
jgi:hypothetical protein